MPNPLNNVTLSGSDYADSATIEAVWGGNGGAFQVKDASVFYVLQYPDPSSGNNRSGFGSAVLTEEREIDPGTGTIPAGVTGIKFRNSNASSPATVSATIAPPNQPVLSLGAPGVVGTSGTTTMITGIIPAAGTTPTAGSGFTYTHTNGTGLYVFTFNTPSPFGTTPTILLSTSNLDAAATAAWGNASAAGFSVQTDASFGNADRSFSFVALATQ